MEPEAGPTTRKRAILAAQPVFSSLPDPLLAQLSDHARVVECPAGSLIFAKGDPGHALYIVLDGAVKISVPSDEGREIALNLIRAGEIFGEIALLDGKVRTADAEAFLATTVMVIDRRDFLHALREEPELGLKLLGIMSDRLRRTSQQVEDISFVDWPSRLATRPPRRRPPSGRPRPRSQSPRRGRRWSTPPPSSGGCGPVSRPARCGRPHPPTTGPPWSPRPWP